MEPKTPRRSIRFTTGANGRMPASGYNGDAGFDLYVSCGITIAPGSTADVPHDICVELPMNVWGMIIGRSSTIRKRGLMVSIGIIDQGYRGEFWTACTNLTNAHVTIAAGDRISQFIPFELTAASVQFVKATRFNVSERGSKGFGSSGH